MTAIHAEAAPVVASANDVSFLRQTRSEYIKLITVRGTWWSVAIVAALTWGIAFLVTWAVEPPMDNMVVAVVMPVQFTMMLAGILGVISVTGEYSTGMVRSTMTANPTRGSVVAAKALVLGVFMTIVSLVTFGIAAVAISPLAASKGMALDWSDPEKTLLPILAVSAVMGLFSILGVGIGFVLRSGAGAIAVTVGILFVLPIIVSMVGMWLYDIEWVGNLGNYLPSTASQMAVLPFDGSPLTSGEAWLVMGGWPAAALLGAWAVVRQRDV